MSGVLHTDVSSDHDHNGTGMADLEHGYGPFMADPDMDGYYPLVEIANYSHMYDNITQVCLHEKAI